MHYLSISFYLYLHKLIQSIFLIYSSYLAVVEASAYFHLRENHEINSISQDEDEQKKECLKYGSQRKVKLC